MAVEVDLPALICTNEFVVAVGTIAVGTGVGAGVGVGVWVGVGLGETTGEGVADVCGRIKISFAKLPRPPSAMVASVKPAANSASIARAPNVAATLCTRLSLLLVILDIQIHDGRGHTRYHQ